MGSAVSSGRSRRISRSNHAFDTAAARLDNNDARANAFTALLATRCSSEWEDIGIKAKVGLVCADAATAGSFFSTDPQSTANGFAPECTHTRFGRHRRWGPIVTVNGERPEYGSGVLAGEHTDQILVELGFDPADLRSRHVVASERP